jgi:hypothetical protein
MANKPIASQDELLLMIDRKRALANEAIREVILRISGGRRGYLPIQLLLDYLSNMVPALELMLKLLSGDSSGHDFAAMHCTVFGQPHPNPAFMAYLKQAMTNQKYLYEPVGREEWFFAEMKELDSKLSRLIAKKFPASTVYKDLLMPKLFTEFLRDSAQGEERLKLEQYLNAGGLVRFGESCASARLVIPDAPAPATGGESD